MKGIYTVIREGPHQTSSSNWVLKNLAKKRRKEKKSFHIRCLLWNLMEIFKLSHFHRTNCRELACTLLKLDVLQELVWYWTLCRNKALIFCGLALRGSLDIFHTSYTHSTGHHCVLPTAFTTTKPYTENCKSWSPSCHADWSHIGAPDPLTCETTASPEIHLTSWAHWFCCTSKRNPLFCTTGDICQWHPKDIICKSFYYLLVRRRENYYYY